MANKSISRAGGWRVAKRLLMSCQQSLIKLTAEADLSAASAVWSSGAVGTAGCAAEGKLFFVHGVVVSHLDLVDVL